MSDADPSVDQSRMSFVQHLGELRRRLMWSVIVLFVFTIAGFEFAPELFEWLRGPLVDILNVQMIALDPMETFVTYLKLAMTAAVFVSSPFILYQVWGFVSPGLYKHEKRWILPFVVFGSLFFIGGGAFAYYLAMPLAFKAMVAMTPASVQPAYSMASYFSLVLQLLLAFGAIFELPLIMWIVAAAGIAGPKAMARVRKYWLIVAFVVAGVLTPPDVITQIMMVGPLLAFFELGILGARLLYREPATNRKSEAAPG